MKKYILPIVLVIVFVSGYFIYSHFISVEGKANRVLEAIKDGEIYYAPTMSGSILYDAKKRTTQVVGEDILLKSGKKFDFHSLFELQHMVFQLPKDIQSFRLLNSSTDTVSFLSHVDISEEAFDDTWKTVYPTRDSFINNYVSLYKDYLDFHIDSTNQQIVYKEKPVQEKRFTYNIDCVNASYRTQLIFIKEQDGWKLGAVFTQEI